MKYTIRTSSRWLDIQYMRAIEGVAADSLKQEADQMARREGIQLFLESSDGRVVAEYNCSEPLDSGCEYHDEQYGPDYGYECAYGMERDGGVDEIEQCGY
jgi:hypothetical protein